MNQKLHTDEIDHLFDAILTLKDKDECYKLFSDVCTIKELQAMAQRYEVAIMLSRKMTYLDIAEKTGASTATISRVNRSLTYGEDGYHMTFKRLGIEDGGGETSGENSGKTDGEADGKASNKPTGESTGNPDPE